MEKKKKKTNRFADFKIADEAVDEVNEYFWLEIFTKKMKISQISTSTFSGSISSSDTNWQYFAILM